MLRNLIPNTIYNGKGELVIEPTLVPYELATKNSIAIHKMGEMFLPQAKNINKYPKILARIATRVAMDV
jgi:hypothetical protein